MTSTKLEMKGKKLKKRMRQKGMSTLSQRNFNKMFKCLQVMISTKLEMKEKKPEEEDAIGTVDIKPKKFR